MQITKDFSFKSGIEIEITESSFMLFSNISEESEDLKGR